MTFVCFGGWSGCVSSDDPSQWREGSAVYEDQDGHRLTLRMYGPVDALDAYGRRVEAHVFEQAPPPERPYQGYNRHVLDPDGRQAMVLLECTAMSTVCHSGHYADWSRAGGLPPYGFGYPHLLERDGGLFESPEAGSAGGEVDLATKVSTVDGRLTITVQSPEDHRYAFRWDGTFTYDASPFPVEMVVDYSSTTSRFTRISVESGPPLAPLEPWPTPPAPATRASNPFPGAEDPVEGLSVPPLAYYEALLDESEEARRLAQSHCFVGFELRVEPPRSDGLLGIVEEDGSEAMFSFQDGTHKRTWTVQRTQTAGLATFRVHETGSGTGFGGCPGQPPPGAPIQQIMADATPLLAGSHFWYGYSAPAHSDAGVVPAGFMAHAYGDEIGDFGGSVRHDAATGAWHHMELPPERMRELAPAGQPR